MFSFPEGRPGHESAVSSVAPAQGRAHLKTQARTSVLTSRTPSSLEEGITELLLGFIFVWVCDLLEFGENRQWGGMEEKRMSRPGKRDGERTEEGQLRKAEDN